MTLPTASEMAEAISSTYNILNERRLTVDIHSIYSLISSLKGKKTSNTWNISTGTPIVFKEFDSNGKKITPQLMSSIEVDTSSTGLPYREWNVSLELFDKRSQDGTAELVPISRWHLDLANSAQSGPKLHLQCGGHFSQNGVRSLELDLAVPRWPHPLFDLLLMTEVIVANFYEDEWLLFRETPNWCQAMSHSQNLCYAPYWKEISKHIGVSGTTILNQTWNESA